VVEHGVGIRVNGKERFDFQESRISEGWVKMASGKTVDRNGKPVMITLKGKVKEFHR
jgi:hypothetical protein